MGLMGASPSALFSFSAVSVIFLRYPFGVSRPTSVVSGKFQIVRPKEGNRTDDVAI